MSLFTSWYTLNHQKLSKGQERLGIHATYMENPSMTDSPVHVAVAEKPAEAVHGPRGRVTIFGLWCKGCRLCVALCPKGVLAFNEDERPVVAHPEKCSACHWCDTHCPDLAIVVTSM